MSTIQEILTREVPFKELNDIQVMKAIVSNKLPEKPENGTIARLDELWNVCEGCWRTNPGDRPKIELVLSMLKVKKNFL